MSSTSYRATNTGRSAHLNSGANLAQEQPLPAVVRFGGDHDQVMDVGAHLVVNLTQGIALSPAQRALDMLAAQPTDVAGQQRVDVTLKDV